MVVEAGYDEAVFALRSYEVSLKPGFVTPPGFFFGTNELLQPF